MDEFSDALRWISSSFYKWSSISQDCPNSRGFDREDLTAISEVAHLTRCDNDYIHFRRYQEALQNRLKLMAWAGRSQGAIYYSSGLILPQVLDREDRTVTLRRTGQQWSSRDLNTGLQMKISSWFDHWWNEQEASYVEMKTSPWR